MKPSQVGWGSPMGNVKEIVLDPKDVVRVRWYRFWKKKVDPPPSREFVNELVITTSDGLVLNFRGRKYISRLLGYLGLKYNELKDLPVLMRNARVEEALKERANKLKISYVETITGNYVVRVVSEEFVPIPHKHVSAMIFIALRDLGYEPEMRVVKMKRGFFAGFVLGSGSEYRTAIWFYNYNDGRHALRIWGGLFRTVCGNPLITTSAHVVHRWDTEESIRRAVEKVVELVRRLDIDEYDIPRDEAWRYIHGLYYRFPQYVVSEVTNVARREFANADPSAPVTNLQIANALTWLIPRRDWPDYVKLGLLREARKWLVRK